MAIPPAWQPPCDCRSCLEEQDFGGCSASPWQSTGTCPGPILPLKDGRLGWTYGGTCKHYGTEVDGPLCEGCYVATK